MKDKFWAKPIKGEWASALQKYLVVQSDPVPPGWKRTRETLKAMGLKCLRGGGRSVMLAEMVQNGILEKKRFRVKDLSGRRLVMCDHFRLIGKPK